MAARGTVQGGALDVGEGLPCAVHGISTFADRVDLNDNYGDIPAPRGLRMPNC